MDGYFTTDNADSNDNMLRWIAKEIPGFDPITRRIRCQGHIINLAVQAFLFEKDTEALEETLRQFQKLTTTEREGQRDRISTAQEWRKQAQPLPGGSNQANNRLFLISHEWRSISSVYHL
ncbi:hypothetical protein LTR28_012767, partial [Elasticomyces elasticus]